MLSGQAMHNAQVMVTIRNISLLPHTTGLSMQATSLDIVTWPWPLLPCTVAVPPPKTTPPLDANDDRHKAMAWAKIARLYQFTRAAALWLLPIEARRLLGLGLHTKAAQCCGVFMIYILLAPGPASPSWQGSAMCICACEPCNALLLADGHFHMCAFINIQ